MGYLVRNGQIVNCKNYDFVDKVFYPHRIISEKWVLNWKMKIKGCQTENVMVPCWTWQPKITNDPMGLFCWDYAFWSSLPCNPKVPFLKNIMYRKYISFNDDIIYFLNNRPFNRDGLLNAIICILTKRRGVTRIKKQ